MRARYFNLEPVETIKLKMQTRLVEVSDHMLYFSPSTPPTRLTFDQNVIAMGYARDNRAKGEPTISAVQRQRHIELCYAAEAERNRRVEERAKEYERTQRQKPLF